MDPTSNDILVIDGSYLEGGGQILRNAFAYSALLKRPIRVEKIRANRTPPGLRPQHAAGLELMSRISVGSRLTGCAKGSSIVEFYPGEIQTSGTFEADPKTAGSTTLLLQVSLPCFLLTAPDTTGAVNTLDLRGGTNATSAPPIDFVSNIFFPFISKYFELHPTVDIRTRGYYPRGGGEIFVSVPAIVGPIKPLELVDRGDVTQIYGRAYVAGSLPVHLINKMVDAAKAKLVEAGYSKSQIAIEKVREPSDGAVGNGSGIFVWAETAGGCILSGGSIGERGRDAGEVGRAGAEELISNLAHNGCVDEHLQDQIIIIMALAEGQSKVSCGPISLHTKTAIWIAELMTGAKFTIMEQTEGVLIQCEGIGYCRASS